MRSISDTAATPMPALKALRIHEPRLIGDVSLMVRIMLTKRSGLPRSFTSAAAPSITATKPDSRALRRNVFRPVSWAPAASRPDPPATPPRNR